MNTLFLTGMMGSGKSAIGRILAAKMNWYFIDLDKEIEHHANMSIARMFKEYDENSFRKLEKEVSRHLKLDKCIVSTGGGFPILEENRHWMREKGIIVWLNVSPEIIFERVKNRTHRPLLENNMNCEYIENLLKTRIEAYSDADISINADSNDLEAKTELIIKKVIDAQYRN